MNILFDEIKRAVQDKIIQPLLADNFHNAVDKMPDVLADLYAAIPDNKRISYGRVHTIKVLSEYLFKSLSACQADIYGIACSLFENSEHEWVRGIALGILSLYGQTNFTAVLPWFIQGAVSDNWDLREFAQMFFRRLIKAHPEDARQWLAQQAESPDPNLRRFVSETLRPVQENRWFHKQPDFPLSVLRKLFRESAAYPRTSVGNNLSDHARRNSELVFELVVELVSSGDKNSHWIATRDCRNLVKTEPIRVMDLLGVDTYKYKTRVYHRYEYSGN